MDKMEDYKEKIKNILSGLSLPAEDLDFWVKALDLCNSEEFPFIFEELEAISPDEIRFFTRIAREAREAIRANDAEKLECVLAEDWVHFKSLVQKYVEAKNLYCLQKVKEKAVSQN